MSTDSKASQDQRSAQDEGNPLRIDSSTDNTDTNNDENKTARCKETAIQIEPTPEKLGRDGKVVDSVKTRSSWVYYMNEPQYAPAYRAQRVYPPIEYPPIYYPPMEYTPARNWFVAAVFTIVFVMVLATAGITMVVYNVESIKRLFWALAPILLILSAITMLSVSYAVACSACARQSPCSIICLFLALFSMSVPCCYVTLIFKTGVVILAIASTAGVLLVCLLLALTRFDFTSWMLYVIVVAAAIGICGMLVVIYMTVIGEYIPSLHLAILFAGLVMNVVILVIELQMILGGKAVEMREDEYVLGALYLYTSIIDIFLKLVQLMSFLLDYV